MTLIFWYFGSVSKKAKKYLFLGLNNIFEIFCQQIFWTDDPKPANITYQYRVSLEDVQPTLASPKEEVTPLKKEATPPETVTEDHGVESTMVPSKKEVTTSEEDNVPVTPTQKEAPVTSPKESTPPEVNDDNNCTYKVQ